MKIISIVFIESLMSRIIFDMFLLFKLNAKIALSFREKARFSLNIILCCLTSLNFCSIRKLSTLKIENFDLMFYYYLCRLNRVVNENFCRFFLFRFIIFDCDCNEFSNVEFFFFFIVVVKFCFDRDLKIFFLTR